MTISIMQPYFLPYIGYWQLIANSDKFVFFDVVQYNKRSWMNRNRILHPIKVSEFQYISVPIKKHSQGTHIKDIYINYSENWKAKIFGQLTVYKKLKAPYYNTIINILEKVLKNENYSFLELIIELVREICKYLEIDFKYEVASNIDFDKSIISEAGDWALSISKKLGANTYINPYGGHKIFNEEKYNHNNINIKFLKSKLSPYKQSWRDEFTAGLSIIDLLMFNDKTTLKKILKEDYTLFTKTELENLNEE